MTSFCRPQTIASETIDDESIVIDLTTGAYYSFLGWSAWAWQSLCAGADPADLESTVGVEADLPSFVAALAEAGLLVDRGDMPMAEFSTEPPGTPEKLVFERFDDMADMILLDPVHDVDHHDGWPRAADKT